MVARFLELLTAQLLQSGSGAPSGLQFHILDLYMTELAAVASAEVQDLIEMITIIWLVVLYTSRF